MLWISTHPIFAIEGLQEALNNLSSNIVNIENKTVTIQQTLEAGNKTITFYNIPSSETLIEFFASKPINYRKLDDSISGRITLTYPEQDDDVIIYCKIEFLTI